MLCLNILFKFNKSFKYCSIDVSGGHSLRNVFGGVVMLQVMIFLLVLKLYYKLEDFGFLATLEPSLRYG